MPINTVNYQSALSDFNEARLKASLQEVLARLTGKPNELLSYDEVAQKLKLRARADRGVHEIPVKAIIGKLSSNISHFTPPLLRHNINQSRRLSANYQVI